MQTILLTLLTASATVLALYLGAVLPLWLPGRFPSLDRKPFNCRPCTTFHLLWMLIGAQAWWLGSIGLFMLGLAIAFIVFGIVNYTENKKISK